MESYVLVKLLMICFCFGLVTTDNATNKTHRGTRHSLMSYLMVDYDTRILPVRNSSHSVPVQYDMSLNQIVELFWKDEYLIWDPAEYDGIKSIFISVDTIWRPDIVLYNSVDVERTAFEVFPVGMAEVTYDGSVRWPAPVIMQSMCRIKVDQYPFDEQRCPLKFGSWVYDGSELNLTAKSTEISLSNYVKSIEWEVLDTPCKTNVIYYDCCPEPYPDVTCYVVMRRRPNFYLFNLVLPTVLLLLIGLLVFCLPPESGEKVSLAITVLLAMSVYMLIVMDNVPANAEAIPLLEIFIGATLGMLTLSTVMAVLVVNISFRGAYSRPPYWLRSCCFNCLAYICCLRQEVEDLDDTGEPIATATSYHLQNGTGGKTISTVEKQHNYITTSVTDIKLDNIDSNPDSATNTTLREILQELRQQSQRMQERYQEKKQECAGEAEWRIVAMVMDRSFFFILLILTLIMSFVIFREVL